MIATRSTGINWIGLWTMIRREIPRMMRVPIQAFVAPWISALLFIFIFGFVVGGRITSIGGHRYLEFVLPGILMMNIVNAAFLQSTSQIYFQRFLRFIEEMLVAPLSYVEMIVGSLAMRDAALGHHGARHSADRRVLRRHVAYRTLRRIPVLGRCGVDDLRLARHHHRRCGPRISSSSTCSIVFFITPLSMVGGVFNTVEHAAALAALAGLWQSVLLFHQRAAPFDDRLQRRPRRRSARR